MNETKTWWVYIIATSAGKLYTGITTDVQRRFLQHAAGTKSGGARFFRTASPQTILFQEAQENRSNATIREREIKKLTRLQKLKLIATNTEKTINQPSPDENQPPRT